MASIYRLSSEEWRQWRLNTYLLVAAVDHPSEEITEGQVLRDATEDEIAAHYEGEPFSAAKDGREIVEVGVGSVVPAQATLLDVKLLRAKDWLSNVILSAKGEAVVKAPNGRFLAKLRDPATSEHRKRGAGTGPSPAVCQCREFAGREEGKHHYMCQHNRVAPMEERAQRWLDEHMPKERVFRRERLRKPGQPKLGPSRKPPPVVPPSECDCRHYTFAKAGQEHHPMCANRSDYEKYLKEQQAEAGKPAELKRAEVLGQRQVAKPAPQAAPPVEVEATAEEISETGYWLFDKAGNKVRPADADEVEGVDETCMVTVEGAKYVVADADGNPPPPVAPTDQAPPPEDDSTVEDASLPTSDTLPSPQP